MERQGPCRARPHIGHYQRDSEKKKRLLALRYHGNKDVRPDDVPPSLPGPGEVRARVAHTGICATDSEEQYVTIDGR